MTHRDPDQTPITDLPLSPKALRVLRNAHLNTIADLQSRRHTLFRIRNIGKTLQTEILATLAAWESGCIKPISIQETPRLGSMLRCEGCAGPYPRRPKTHVTMATIHPGMSVVWRAHRSWHQGIVRSWEHTRREMQVEIRHQGQYERLPLVTLFDDPASPRVDVPLCASSLDSEAISPSLMMWITAEGIRGSWRIHETGFGRSRRITVGIRHESQDQWRTQWIAQGGKPEAALSALIDAVMMWDADVHGHRKPRHPSDVYVWSTVKSPNDLDDLSRQAAAREGMADAWLETW